MPNSRSKPGHGLELSAVAALLTAGLAVGLSVNPLGLPLALLIGVVVAALIFFVARATIGRSVNSE